VFLPRQTPHRAAHQGFTAVRTRKRKRGRPRLLDQAGDMPDSMPLRRKATTAQVSAAAACAVSIVLVVLVVHNGDIPSLPQEVRRVKRATLVRRTQTQALRRRRSLPRPARQRRRTAGSGPAPGRQADEPRRGFGDLARGQLKPACARAQQGLRAGQRLPHHTTRSCSVLSAAYVCVYTHTSAGATYASQCV